MDLDARSTCWKKVNPIVTTCNCQFHNLFTAKITTMFCQMKIIAGSRQYKTVIKSCLCMHQMCPRKRTILGRPKLLFFVRCFDLFVAVADVVVVVAAVVVTAFCFPLLIYHGFWEREREKMNRFEQNKKSIREWALKNEKGSQWFNDFLTKIENYNQGPDTKKIAA